MQASYLTEHGLPAVRGYGDLPDPKPKPAPLVLVPDQP